MQAHDTGKQMSTSNSNGLSRKLTIWALACMAFTALGLCLIFISLKQPDFDSFSNLVLVACAALIIGGGLGVYCWRLLYLARRCGISRRARMAGVTAALVPVALALLAL